MTDALWKHTWSLSYVLPAEVLWHPPFDPPRQGRRPNNKGAGGDAAAAHWSHVARKIEEKKTGTLIGRGQQQRLRSARATSFHVSWVDPPSDESGGVGGVGGSRWRK